MLRFWERVVTRESILNSALHSLVYAALSATIGIIISCVMAYLLQRTGSSSRASGLPYHLAAAPQRGHRLGLIMTMSGRFGINIYNTMWIMIVAYLIKYLLMGMRTVVSAMSQIHPSLEEASLISGASWLRSFRDVTIPLIARRWWRLFLIFMPCFYELTMSTLSTPPTPRPGHRIVHLPDLPQPADRGGPGHRHLCCLSSPTGC